MRVYSGQEFFSFILYSGNNPGRHFDLIGSWAFHPQTFITVRYTFLRNVQWTEIDILMITINCNYNYNHNQQADNSEKNENPVSKPPNSKVKKKLSKLLQTHFLRRSTTQTQNPLPSAFHLTTFRLPRLKVSPEINWTYSALEVSSERLCIYEEPLPAVLKGSWPDKGAKLSEILRLIAAVEKVAFLYARIYSFF